MNARGREIDGESYDFSVGGSITIGTSWKSAHPNGILFLTRMVGNDGITMVQIKRTPGGPPSPLPGKCVKGACRSLYLNQKDKLY